MNEFTCPCCKGRSYSAATRPLPASCTFCGAQLELSDRTRFSTPLAEPLRANGAGNGNQSAVESEGLEARSSAA
jgi:hypothetical protein